VTRRISCNKVKVKVIDKVKVIVKVKVIDKVEIIVKVKVAKMLNFKVSPFFFFSLIITKVIVTLP
jgi:hypothetical protein